MPLAPNTRLDRYEIRSQIGEGGMGEVYLAQDTELDRTVAIKILPEALASDPQRLQRFIQEAKAASALNHPHILTIYEIGTTAGSRFIATEFIDGETLRVRIRAGMRLAEILEIAIQAGSALAAAHAAGIIHRDIKPENIMVRHDGYLKVLDFGLAKLTEPEGAINGLEAATKAMVNTGAGTVMGTVAYMSPEQARGLQVDARTDIFSFGVVLYEMVAHRLPFEGSTSSEVLASVLSEKEPQPLARYSRDVPTELERIVSKALRKNRDERYQTIKDLLLDLQSLKQELEFERKLERSVPPRAEADVATSQAAEPSDRDLPSRASTKGKFVPAGSVGTASVSSVEYVVSEIKQHKGGAVSVLSVLLLAAIGIGYWFFIHRPSAVTNVTTINSIAVLPFENMTHDQNTEYFSDGVTESLINSLSQLPHIKVIARGSVFSYKNQTPDLQQVARKLNVQAVLTGRVLVQGDTLSVSVEMTDTQNNTQLWGQHYTRKAADIFAVQDEIARQVTDTLRVRLTGGQQEQVTKRYTENTEAYRLYLQGRYYFNQFSEESLNRSVSFFDQAIALDPRYALAYAARGESFRVMGGLSLPMSEAGPKAKQDVATALSIDDKLLEARTTQAEIKYHFDWDFAAAEENFKQVIALNPNYAEAHQQYGFYLVLMGRPMEGVAEMKLAQQLDPVNPSINVGLCLPYYLGRQFDQSVAQTRKTVEMFPNVFLGHMALGQALFQKGDISAGIEELEKAKAMEPGPLTIGVLGYAYAKSGDKDEARKSLAELKELSKRHYVTPYFIAMIYAGLDEKDEAFAWLEKAYQERSVWLIWIKMDPMVDGLRSDARFTDLMRRLGFPP
ncbi:MAG: protein kinase [Pyrinomonadaceae bacterium]|nr:protein kinase [Pyrinomonadaceae bacterium]